MNSPIVHIADLYFSYNGQEVLQHINLTVNKGDFVSIIGPNGGGKTTLLKLILGLLRPTRGTVHIKGKMPLENGTVIGYVPQFINHNLNFHIQCPGCEWVNTIQQNGLCFVINNRTVVGPLRLLRESGWLILPGGRSPIFSAC